MKLLCLILSVYVMVLSTNPCCTDDDCQGKAATPKEHSQNKPAKANDCPGCSPFFTCGSCIGFIMAKPFTLNTTMVFETVITIFSHYQQPPADEISLAIWQPPKIS